MTRTCRFRAKTLALSLIVVSFLGCVSTGAGRDGETARRPGGYGEPSKRLPVQMEVAEPIGTRTIRFLENDAFVLTEFSGFTVSPSEAIVGETSLTGRNDSNRSYAPYLHTDPESMPLEPLATYRVTFDYRILETPDRGFETILYSPTAGQQDIWLPGWDTTGTAGDAGTAEFKNTLADFDDYQVRWNIIGTGSIAIDNVRIENVDTGDEIIALDLEATESTIDVNQETIRTKVSNRATVPVFYAWTGPGSATLYDTVDSPYGLVWTTYGAPLNLENTEPDVPPIDSHRMQADRDTLYLVEMRWHYWYPSIHTLSPDSEFYLDEVFESHIGSEFPETLVIDFENPRWPDVLAEKAANFRLAGFDGLLLDWWNDDAGNGRPERDVQAARLAIAREIRRRVGDAFILMGNVNFHVDDPTAEFLSGVFMELWKPEPNRTYVLTYDEEDGDIWTPSIERFEDALLYWDSALQWPRVIAFEPWKVTTGDFVADRTSAENQRLARLFAAMACVIPENGYILYADNNDDWDGGDHQHAYYDFYRTDLGSPTSGRIEVVDGVAYREYEHGVIAYNRTATGIDVVLPSGTTLRIGSLQGVFTETETTR